MFKRIVAATDSITLSHAPVLTAIDLRIKTGADLYILHVLEPGSQHNRRKVRHFETNEEITADRGYHDHVAGRLSRTYAQVTGPDAKIRYETRTGFPWKEIIRLARKIKADLIIMGPHSERMEQKDVLRAAGKIGSTVQGVVTREKCPVMVVNKQVSKQMLEFKNILVGVDFSLSCECALCFAGQISRWFGSKIFSFFMLPVPPWPKFKKNEYLSNREIFLSRLVKFCGFYLEDIDHEYMIQSGVLPHQEILKCTEKVKADLILLGSHTKKKKGKWYAGSVVEKTSIHADCPVIAINDPQALRPWKDARVSTEMQSLKMRSIHMYKKRLSSQVCA